MPRPIPLLTAGEYLYPAMIGDACSSDVVDYRRAITAMNLSERDEVHNSNDG
jgi:hypothetical protein